MTKKISLEHSIRNIITGQNVQTENAEPITELTAAPLVKNAGSGMALLKSFLKPKVKPVGPSVPQIKPTEPAGPSVPQVKPVEPAAPATKPAIAPKETPKPAVPPAAPDAKPASPKPEEPKTSTPTPAADTTPKTDSATTPPNSSKSETETKTEKEPETDKKRRGFSMGDSDALAPAYKKSRIGVNTTAGLAKKRTKLQNEDVETKNRKLVDVVKKTVDDKKKKAVTKGNTQVDMHPTLNDPDQDETV